ncbi:malate:quinone oxidoreductase [Sporosarcina trichiuri]|uniref:malate:quinone oxidoreductase n=1 Tax=Sporosarcina trichiuri TaxID=3056445 RepID=UPI0025B39A49|nr:malate:quinone oxidoreductase [Sporosarcina sp. 0.2-SM1T-5]WJY26836.1 malate:quinone oxidoreductase [Sporosarcina sp. 0.2-SM1T-5]
MSNGETNTDVILIGAGIMSATLGTMLKELVPEWNITVFEKLSEAGEESSNEWNNAGTGHAALCELNYTTEQEDGSVNISKAININEQFQVSKQFWSFLVDNGRLHNPEDFIRPLPHMSFVQGKDNVSFLKKRYETMKQNPLFDDMEYTEDPETLEKWVPLMMKDRASEEPIAISKIDAGTDVNFGALTNMLFDHLEREGVHVEYRRSVEGLKQKSDGRWEVKVRNLVSGDVQRHTAKFVFIGAGGGSLHLLQKSGIPEGKGIGGFPVSGLFLVCNNPKVAEQHYAKVYGKASVGAPPMSVPHLDTRYINNQKSLLFGPFAGFSPKFLKTGSMMDLITSVKPGNVVNMLSAGVKEMALTKYLVEQLMLTKEQQVEELRAFVPDAKVDEWDTVVAGQRVQVIKETEAGGKGTLQFGTELVSAKDGSIAALLGASPGASTAVHVMINLLNKCFPDRADEWQAKFKEMIPSYGIKLAENPSMLHDVKDATAKTLKLDHMEPFMMDRQPEAKAIADGQKSADTVDR